MKFWNKIKGEHTVWEILIPTFIWAIVSLIASFPDFALHFKTDIFFIETKSEYLSKFLIPLIVFVFAFMTDFYISLRSYKIGNRKSYLLKALVFLLVVAFGVCDIYEFSGTDCVVFVVVVEHSLDKSDNVSNTGKE